MTKVMRLAPSPSLYNVVCSFVCSFPASTASNNFFKLGITLTQAAGEIFGIFKQGKYSFRSS